MRRRGGVYAPGAGWPSGRLLPEHGLGQPLPACQSSFLSGVPFRNACNSCQRVAQSCQALTAFEAVNGSRREAPLLVIQRLCLKPM